MSDFDWYGFIHGIIDGVSVYAGFGFATIHQGNPTLVLAGAIISVGGIMRLWSAGEQE